MTDPMGNLHFSGVFFSMSSLHFQKSEGNKKTELFGTPPDGCKTVGIANVDFKLDFVGGRFGEFGKQYLYS